MHVHPNATHLLQPLDVAFFKPLKGEWRLEAKNKGIISEERFLSLLNEALYRLEARDVNSVTAGFTASETGVF